MELYFIRHGKTNYNELGLRNDDPARPVQLTEEGICKADPPLNRLATNGGEKSGLDIMF